jgi:MFS transporter, OFA family, oxalate/formate antiporter
MDQPIKNRGIRVTISAVCINLALGILYAWSVISKEIPGDWGWKEAEKSWPYAIACLVFAIMMVPAGRLQDRIGPRLVATLGGILVGAGMILASTTTSYWGYVIGFGVLAGTGIGFGYASATPPAVKWFRASRTGMIAGIVVSGFGLASVYAAPLSKWLIAGAPAPEAMPAWAPGWISATLASLASATQRLQHWVESFGIGSGVPATMFILGVGFLVVVILFSQMLTPPPKGYVPRGAAPAAAAGAAARKEEFSPTEMLHTVQFYLLWFLYACGAGAGLMIIAKLAKIAEFQADLKLGFLLVAALAVGNGGGRILAGTLSDKLGRRQTMFGCFVVQAILMLVLTAATKGSFLATAPAMAVISALIGANYGANLSLFPSITKDYYGLKNFGVNYGLVFTAWGVGGFLLSLLAGKLFDRYGTFAYSCYIASGFLVLAAILTFTVKPPHAQHESAAGTGIDS